MNFRLPTALCMFAVVAATAFGIRFATIEPSARFAPSPVPPTNPELDAAPAGGDAQITDVANRRRRRARRRTIVATDSTSSPQDGNAEVKLIPRRIFFGNPDKAGVQISSDGKYLSFVAPLDGVLNVWVAPADNLEAARAITHDTHRGVRSYFWAFTNRHILYSQDKDGDENSRLYCVDLETDEIRDITPGKKPEAKEGNAKAAPVAARVQAVSHRQPTEILVAVNDRDPRWHDIYRVNILTGENTLVQKNEGFRNFTVDEDYQVRFAARYLPDGGIQYYKPQGERAADAGYTDWADFLKVERPDTANTGIGGFDKTGQVLYMIDSRGRDTGALTTLDLKTGETKVIASDPRTDAGAIKWHPTENTVQAISFYYQRRERKIFDEEVGKDIEFLQDQHTGELGIADYTLDDRQWIVVYTKDDGPVGYYLFNRDTRELRFLFVNRKSLTETGQLLLAAQVGRSRRRWQTERRQPDGAARPWWSLVA